MRTRALVLSVIPALLLVGCATSEEWATWREHTSHYASGDHLRFSWKNGGKAPTPKVTRQDVANARDQNWWGKPITVDQAQILER